MIVPFGYGLASEFGNWVDRGGSFPAAPGRWSGVAAARRAKRKRKNRARSR